MERATVDQLDAARAFFAALEKAHQAEDAGTYAGFFDADAVWVTGRGVCVRGRDRLTEYLRGAIPGGLSDGSVRYVVESAHLIGSDLGVVIVDQTYTNADGEPRDEHAQHTHTYVVSFTSKRPRILAGQKTVRAAD